ncbi:Vitamin B12 import ATP-binding protein BtuD [Mycolicibacterium aubagnense]
MAEAIARDGEDKGPDYLASLRLVARYVDTSRTRLAAAIMLATVAVGAELLPVWCVYRVASAAIEGTMDWTFVLIHAAIALTGVAFGVLALGLSLALSHVVAFDVIYRLRLDIARHMARLPLGYFADRRSGDAKKLVIDEPEKLETIVAHGLPEGTSALATWLAVSIWLFVVDWRMALATVAVAPVSFLLLTLAMKRGGKRAGAYQAAGARMNGSIVEYLTGMPVVKIFNRTGESFAETADAVRSYAAIETLWARDFIPLGGTFNSLVLANITVISPVGLALLWAGWIDLPTLLFFVILGASYSQPLLKLFNQFHTLAHISMGSTLVAHLLKAEPQHNSGRLVNLPNHDIAFDKVSFAYHEQNVLHEITFTARAGEVTALVGASGSGKSTIASLIPRFHDAGSGKVTVGGVDVRDMGVDQLMNTIAFVFQDTVLFSDTIAANIRFGKREATDAEVQAAASAASAHDFIDALPQGYRTHLGEHGHSLSGGERQRLAIARAILKDAPVIVLDEATAFADPDNEAAIQDAIGALTAGRTLIVVAHRLHTIVAADRILVVDGGRIVESGRHDELVAEGGHYARLWNDYVCAQAVTLNPQDTLEAGAAE